MNILLFVTTIIMALSMMTYARFQLYRNFSAMQSQFNTYMEKTERGFINKQAEWWFDNSRSETRKGGGTQNKVVGASSRVTFLYFIDKTKQAQHAAVYPKLLILSKKLINYLYRDQPFFQQFEQQRPDIVDAFLTSLIVADNLPKEQKIKDAQDLASLELGDPMLDSFSYFIFKGSVIPEKKQEETEEKPPSLMSEMKDQKEGKAEVDDENGDANKKEEFKTPEGYKSLLNDITLTDTPKIRVYLAPRDVLMAIFDEPAAVNGIIEMRNDLYKKVLKDMSPDEASKIFESAVAPKADQNFDQSILNYSVTKTNPKNYE
jgi:hypothetical protein